MRYPVATAARSIPHGPARSRYAWLMQRNGTDCPFKVAKSVLRNMTGRDPVRT